MAARLLVADVEVDKMNRRSAWAAYISAAFLLVFYLSILISGMKPSVSDEYRMYYIEDQLAYYLPDGELSQYGVNEKYEYAADGKYRNQGKGWGDVTENGTWTHGAESYLYFYLEAKNNDGYKMMLETKESLGKSIFLLVNGKKISEWKIESEFLDMDIPVMYVQKGINEIVLQVRDEDGDEMEQGILVTAVGLEEN